ncbi:ADP-ribosylglycohydrolase [Amycolatopsis xylanica]|uniref:ADP-ribosylglycohydrolase n=1 Tax=Amycolatopsis xylanica TaxID=589385 RepID=A0A1H3AQI2_9PSEU|nr:ADP-ribosylglycohydrolase family protein [Amycolatopsis xylanica]SDX31903.1 ADP-ribosylglycohydrolase [Amycolatopsis xylanica]
MEPAEAVAKVEEWLTAVHGPGLVRAERDKVIRIPEGWVVPYNNIAYLDEGRTEKQIFPPPSLIVREPSGELRISHPHPGGLSIPATIPGQQAERELVDPEYAAANLGRLGVSESAIAGWETVDATGQKTERFNEKYTVGPKRRGHLPAENQLETLLQFHNGGWLDRERFLIGLVECEVFIDLDQSTGKIPSTNWNPETSEFQVYTSTKRLPSNAHGYWRIDPATLAEDPNKPNLVINGGPGFTGNKVSFTELTDILARFPRRAERVNATGYCAEADPLLAQLAQETAQQIGLPSPVDLPLREAEQARARGYELTVSETRKIVEAASWVKRLEQPYEGKIVNLLAAGVRFDFDEEGRAVRRVENFGKFHPEAGLGFRYGWHRIVGAYVGFAIGESLGLQTQGRTPEEIKEPLAAKRIGPLTQQLLFMTEGAMRSPHREDPKQLTKLPRSVRNGLLRWLHTQGIPFPKADGWLVKISRLFDQRDPDPAEFAAIRAFATGTATLPLTGAGALLAALPAALTRGDDLTGNPRSAAKAIAGLTHHEQADLDGAAYLAHVFQEVLTKDAFSFPIWLVGRDVLDPAWHDLRAMTEETLPRYGRTGLPALAHPNSVGDGRSTVSVLGRTFAAVAGFENEPERAFRRSVMHDGRTALTGALAGALLGARTGVPGLPQHWVEQLELRDVIENLASDAYFHFDRGSSLFRKPDEWKRRYPRD